MGEPVIVNGANRATNQGGGLKGMRIRHEDLWDTELDGDDAVESLRCWYNEVECEED